MPNNFVGIIQQAPAVPATAPAPASDIAQHSADALHKLKQELDNFIEASAKNHLEMDQQDADALKDALVFRSCPEETYVIVAVVHREPAKNEIAKIRCHRGTPLGGYAYDTVNETYSIECVDHFVLGLVPISFQAVMGEWSFYVPMPESVVEKYLNEKQRTHLSAYKASFQPNKDFLFRFIQLLH